MNVKKLTEASLLSAAFVVLSTAFIGMGFGYFGYIDFVVPVLTAVIYLRCGFKYTVLSSITSLILIICVLGNIPSAILMSQSMIYGIICAFIIPSKKNIMDDLFISSILACIIMIIIDFNFSNLIGYSVITQCREQVNEAAHMVALYLGSGYALTKEYLNIVFYLLIISLPVGTMIITYIFSIILGKKFEFLNENSMKKYKIIRNFRKFGVLIACSMNVIMTAVIIVISGKLLLMIPIIKGTAYIEILINSITYVCYFFLIQDSISTINKSLYVLTHSRILTMIGQLIILITLINYFRIVLPVMVIGAVLVEYVLGIKKRQIYYLSKFV